MYYCYSLNLVEDEITLQNEFPYQVNVNKVLATDLENFQD